MHETTSPGPGIGLAGILVVMAVFGLVGWAIGKGKGRGALGFLLGALLGIIGIVIVCVLPAEGSARSSSNQIRLRPRRGVARRTPPPGRPRPGLRLRR